MTTRKTRLGNYVAICKGKRFYADSKLEAFLLASSYCWKAAK